MTDLRWDVLLTSEVIPAMVEERSRGRVVEMKAQLEIVYKHPAPPQPITQQDLAEIVELRRQKRAIDAALREKRLLIRFGLEHGAIVEPGARTASVGKNLIVA